MPYRRLPNSTPAVLRTLRTARDKYLNTPVAADRLITADQFAQLDQTLPDSLLNRFEQEVSEVDRAQAAQRPLTTVLGLQGARLTMFVSHFHQVLDLGIARGAFALGARSYYGRAGGATAIPPLSSHDELQEAAEHVASGEAARQEAEGAGFKPMALPSAAEVAAVLALFAPARAASQQAATLTNKEQEDVSALYPEAQALAVDLCETVEFNVRKDPSASSRRAKAEAWGVVYVYEGDDATGASSAGGTSGSGGPAGP